MGHRDDGRDRDGERARDRDRENQQERSPFRGAKPPGVGFVGFVERQILEAQRAGEFDDLPGKGRPDPRLHEVSDPLWWAKRLMAREKLPGALPPSLEIRREKEQLVESLLRVKQAQKARDRVEKLNAKIRKLNAQATGGPPTNLSPLDVEGILAQWRNRREALDAEKRRG